MLLGSLIAYVFKSTYSFPQKPQLTKREFD